MENEGRLAAGGPGMPGGFWPRIGAGIPRHSGGGGGAGDDPRHLAPDGGWGVPPDGRGVVPRKLGSLRGDILLESKEYPHALPKKDSGRDGVVASSISFAAALRAPAHSFRCSSISHRKRCAYFAVGTLYFPPRPSLKRPKGRGCGPLPLESRPGAGGSAWDGFPCGRFAGAGGVGAGDGASTGLTSVIARRHAGPTRQSVLLMAFWLRGACPGGHIGPPLRS